MNSFENFSNRSQEKGNITFNLVLSIEFRCALFFTYFIGILFWTKPGKSYGLDSFVANVQFNVEVDITIDLSVLGAQCAWLNVASIFQGKNILEGRDSKSSVFFTREWFTLPRSCIHQSESLRICWSQSASRWWPLASRRTVEQTSHRLAWNIQSCYPFGSKIRAVLQTASLDNWNC